MYDNPLVLEYWSDLFMNARLLPKHMVTAPHLPDKCYHLQTCQVKLTHSHPHSCTDLPQSIPTSSASGFCPFIPGCIPFAMNPNPVCPRSPNLDCYRIQKKNPQPFSTRDFTIFFIQTAINALLKFFPFSFHPEM